MLTFFYIIFKIQTFILQRLQNNLYIHFMLIMLVGTDVLLVF